MHPFQEIESKWQKVWAAHKTFKTVLKPGAPKFYALDMFPYPSGAGLHVGHPKGYTANDIVARYKKTRGFNVLHPMGWDAFGLPAENYAVKTGTHPKVTTLENIANYRTQLSALGLSYDWDRQVDTTDPKYYRWTQWIFLKMFEAGLAFEQDLPINYCPSCKTGLANEEVVGAGLCDRCGTTVERRPIRQWVLRITKYADRLASDVEKLDWPEGIKQMQRNWIGRSEGVEFAFSRDFSHFSEAMRAFGGQILLDLSNEWFLGDWGGGPGPGRRLAWRILGGLLMDGRIKEACDAYPDVVPNAVALACEHGYEGAEAILLKQYGVVGNPFLSVYTTRVDTVYGVTYVVIAPDHKDVAQFVTADQKAACDAYIKAAAGKSDQDRTQGDKEKTGVFSGSYVINPFNGEKVPVWIGDYVLGNYGTGAVMAVPAHDERDFAFAKKMSLAVRQSVGVSVDFSADAWKAKYADDGALVDSGAFTGLSSADARAKMAAFAQEKNFGGVKVNYKLRDWLFSRQRYWGEPIPLIHLDIEDLKKLPHIDNLSQATDANLAYILKRDPAAADEACQGATCDGKVCALVIGGKEYSKVYDGLSSKIVCDWKLPVELPEVEKYEPTGDGKSPLAAVPSFVDVKLAANLSGRRETNTMPQWGGSCWYYLRFMDPQNQDALASKEALDYWGQVDGYVGGAEHAVLHLLYARFWHKFLFDVGVVPHDEPFQALRNQGMVEAFAYETAAGRLVPTDEVEELAEGKYAIRATKEPVKQIVAKMSKSLKNVVTVESVLKEQGADCFRIHEMSLGEFRDTAPWNTRTIVGTSRFLDRAYGFLTAVGQGTPEQDVKRMKLLHKTIKKVGEDVENYKFNTAISALIILTNEGLPADAEMAAEWKSVFARLLHPFAPHLAEELWEKLGNKESVFLAPWPDYEPMMCQDDEVTFAIQISGKLRAAMTFANGVAKEEVIEAALANPDVAKWLEGKKVVREVFVPNKLLNIVAV